MSTLIPISRLLTVPRPSLIKTQKSQKDAEKSLKDAGYNDGKEFLWIPYKAMSVTTCDVHREIAH
jgi:hypothetical protein